MARVDLKCGCGYKFFVGEAQLKTGVECPSCGEPVDAPGAAPAAGKPAPPKAAPKPAAKPAPKPVPEPEPVEDFDSLPASGGPSKNKLYIIGGAVTVFVVAVVAIVLVIALQPKVDYNKQAQLENERRRKMFEEISNSKTGGKTLALPAPAPTPVPEPKAPRSSEYKPMPAPPSPKPVPPPPTPAGTPSTPATPAKVVALSPEVLRRIQAEVLTLHPFYLSLVVSPAEKARLDGLAVAGKGLSEDSDFLQAILMGGKLKSVRDEISMVAQTLPTLERESDENLPVDKVTLSDGRSLNCKIIEEGPDVIKVSRALAGGVGGQMPLRRDNISRIEKGKGIGTEFTTQWQAARKGSLAAMIELLLWCKSNTLTGQGKMVAFTILKSDPSNPQARAEAGLPTDPVKQSEDVSRGGMITYQGRSWPAKELRDKFLSDGYCILEGRWYSKKEKMVTVPGLFRYERQNDKAVLLGGLPLAHDIETTYKATLEAGVGQSGEVPETKLLRRFYSPEMKVALTGRIPANITMPPTTAEQDIRVHVDEGTPPAGTQMTGEVTIHVPVGVPILEASVITVAEVKAGGSITVYHVSGSGDNARRTKLYLCDPKESQSRSIPNELVRGATEVSLVAVIEQQAAYNAKTERRHVRNLVMKGKFIQSPALDIIHHKLIPDYKAVLFPSNNNTVEVFRLKLALAEPMPNVDKLFASNLDVLK
jgi:hypothetical protein